MATKTVKMCDVSGSTNKVKTFRFSIFELGPGSTQFLVSEYEKDVDLCPASLKRGLKFIERGTMPVGSANEIQEPENKAKEPENKAKEPENKAKEPAGKPGKLDSKVKK